MITIKATGDTTIRTAGKYCSEDILVKVPQSGGATEPVIGTLFAVNNGIHHAMNGVDAYSTVVVDVPIPDGYIVPSGELEITENGTHDVTAYASVNVNVESGAGDVLTALVKRTITEFSDSDITEIGGYAFYCCDTLTSVHLPSVKTIAAYAFGDCTILPKVELPLVKKIEANTFRGCLGLEIADFGAATSIATNAFYNCNKLTALIIRTPSVAYISSSTTVFQGTPIVNGTGFIYVPKTLMSEYASATNWSSYGTQFRAIEDYPEICGG